MTPNELRSLAQEATPGPWLAGPGRTEYSASPGSRYVQNWIGDERFTTLARSEADARLIALAPQLALLCAEMGEALESVQEYESMTKTAHAALASLEALEKP